MKCDVKSDAFVASPDERGSVSTSTSNGIISSWHDVATNDEWFSYIEITEYILCPCEKSDLDCADGAGDNRNDVPVRKSLFPHVTPYIKFHSMDCKCSKLPSNISKYLKWKLNAVTPQIVIRTVFNSGYELVTKSDNWSGTWSPPMSDPASFKRVRSHQKVNAFPGSFHIGYKDRLWTHLNRMRMKFGLKEFGFVPNTFVLPRDLGKLEKVWEKSAVNEWIVKPPCSGRGQGVRVINQWWEIPKYHSVIVQRYLSKPKLINGAKFDLRVYVLITSIDPLLIYIYSEGLVRFASVKYVHNSTNLNDRCMHLTNTSINKQSPTYIYNTSVDSRRGHKWSFKSLWSYLENQNVKVTSLWGQIKDIVIKTLISGEAAMNDAVQKNLASTYTCYELYGFDILLDEDCKPWLLEVNVLPSLHTDSPLDVAIKGPLVRNVLNIAGYQIPNNLSLFEERQLMKKYRSPMRQDYRMYSITLSSKERRKQNVHSTMQGRAEYVNSMLEELTRDDIRHLVRYEDELTQLDRFEKIFPASGTNTYLKFFEVSRYYNKLFDAWECQYGEDRREGIQRLRVLCKKRLHLEPLLD